MILFSLQTYEFFSGIRHKAQTLSRIIRRLFSLSRGGVAVDGVIRKACGAFADGPSIGMFTGMFTDAFTGAFIGARTGRLSESVHDGTIGCLCLMSSLSIVV